MVDFNKIDDIFQIITQEDFEGRVVGPSHAVSADEGMTDTVLQWILKNVINIGSEGQKSSDALLNEFNEFVNNAKNQDLIYQVFRMHTIRGWPTTIPSEYKRSVDSNDDVVENTTMAQVINANSSTGIEEAGRAYTNIFCNSPIITPATRNAQIVSLFMNTIPTHIMSLCTPKLEIKFGFNRIKKEDKNPSLYPGNLKFLLGAKNYDSLGTFDRAIHRGHADLDNSSGGAKMLSDIFFAPQTMVNMDTVSLSTSERFNQIIDPMRPLASLENLSINVSPTRGFMTNKVVTMTIKLHDRSRLAELADIIKPDNYPLTTVWLSYGWNFPQGIDVGKEGYGELIRKISSPREAYGIKNSSFSFTENGEVTISLELFTKGHMACKNFKITDGDANGTLGTDGVKSVHYIMTAIQDLMSTIRIVRRDLNLNPPPGVDSKEVRTFKLLDAAENNALPDMSGKEFRTAFKELNQMLAQFSPQKVGGNAKESNVNDYDMREKAQALLDAISVMYDTKDTTSKEPKFNEGADSLIKKALEAQFKSALAGHDPYLPKDDTPWYNNQKHPFAATVENYNKHKKEFYSTKQKASSDSARETIKDFPVGEYKLVSFAKLITCFIAAPLLSTGTETQCFFHMFNNQAGNAANCNIGEFPVEIPIVLDNYRSVVIASGDANVSLEQFLQIVIASSVGDARGIGYGMREFYEPYKSSDKHAELKKSKQKNYEETVREFSKKLGGYRPPEVVVEIETINQRTTGDEGENFNEITRIHFYDKQLSPYKDAEVILRGSDGKSLYMVPANDYVSVTKDYGSLVATAQQTPNDKASKDVLAIHGERLEGDATALEENHSGDGRLTGATPQEFKDLIARTIPMIKYGISTTAILSADLSTKADDTLGTINMIGSMKGGRGSAVNPNGSGKGGLPLMTIPAQLQINSIGCPLLHPVQQYFFDFSTGTTIDNIYVLTKLSHEFQPGGFTSSATYAFYDSYARYYGAQTALDQLRFELQKLSNKYEENSDKKK